MCIRDSSCVIDGQSWDKTSGNRDDLVKKYGQAQTSIFQRQASWGWFFWTLQFESGDGGEWGYIPTVSYTHLDVYKRQLIANIPKSQILRSACLEKIQHGYYQLDRGYYRLLVHRNLKS